ncbi:putative quinol monooxygenase [Pedobacter agri]|uniref:putative quinol monooxygenase n=1 Tax=Pedobacter agri TaxID=454586 RepID=UPI002931C32C|nr:antibiotic biosynthesis monooxygenase family protein [Pedobacter agri]
MNKSKSKTYQIVYLFALTFFATIIPGVALAQQDARKFRIAKIEVYPEYLEQYKSALAEHAKAAVSLEPGVIALQAVYDKSDPLKVTVFEVYASEKAYSQHLQAKHFLKYKNGTIKMVKKLELIEVAPIAIELKNLLSNHQ